MTASADLRARVAQLYAEYADCIDSGHFDEWPSYFTEQGWYRIVARENYDAGHPLSILSFKGRAMMKDRIYGISSTIYHAPYYQRHVISIPSISRNEEGLLTCKTNYSVFRIKRDMPAEIFNVGCYYDVIEEDETEGLKFQKKFCVFDNDLVPNSLIYPI